MHPELVNSDKIRTMKPKFKEIYKKKGSTMPTVFSLYKCEIAELVFSMLLNCLLNYSTAYFLSSIIKQIELGQESVNENVNLISTNFILILFSLLFAPLVYQYYYFRSKRLSFRVRAVLLSMISDKILNFSTSSSEDHKEGKILNYLQTDIMKLEYLISNYYGCAYLMISLAVGIAFSVFLVRWAIVGVILMTVFMNIIYLLVYKFRIIYFTELLKFKDERIELVKSVLKRMQFIKLSCLENFFVWKISKKREKEMVMLKRLAIVGAFGFVIEWVTPGMTQLALSLYYMLISPEEFNFAQFSAFLQIFELIKRSTLVMNLWLNDLVECLVSLNRIDKFLNAEEMDLDFLKEGGKHEGEIVEGGMEGSSEEDISLEIENGNFVWTKEQKEVKKSKKKTKKEVYMEDMDEEKKDIRTSSKPNLGRHKFSLTNINFKIEKNKKIFIVGKSSSGKSSLLYSILGEMTSTSPNGCIRRKGRLNYMSQNQWSFADSVKENISLGEEYNKEKMEKCIRMAQMTKDLGTMVNGLDTLLGDTGFTISGGQRARLALARCFYQE